MFHEIAHLILHSEPGASKEREGEANRFSAATLVPKAAFFREFPRPQRYRFNWPAIVAMKTRWGMSIQAIVHRARILGLIDEAQERPAFMHISHSGWRTKEPAEKAPEEPQLSATFIGALRDSGRIAELYSDSFEQENFSESLGIAIEDHEASRVMAMPRRPKEEPPGS